MFDVGARVEWNTGRGGNRRLTGVVVAVVPAYACAYAEIRRRKLCGVTVQAPYVERSCVSYIVDIGAQARCESQRYVIAKEWKLRVAAHG